MTEQHTAEPWEPAPPDSVKSVQMSNRDYRRAVACVNACKGIPTEKLERLAQKRPEPIREFIDLLIDHAITP